MSGVTFPVLGPCLVLAVSTSYIMAKYGERERGKKVGEGTWEEDSICGDEGITRIDDQIIWPRPMIIFSESRVSKPYYG